jgi:hypothetical protein
LITPAASSRPAISVTVVRGIVTIGIERSYVRSGEISKLGSQCDTGRMVLTDADSPTAGAGQTFREFNLQVSLQPRHVSLV